MLNKPTKTYLGEENGRIYDGFDMTQPAAALQPNQVVAHGKRASPDH